MRFNNGELKLKIAMGLAVAVLGITGAGSARAQAPDVAPGMEPHRPPMERAMGPRGEHGRWWNDPQAVSKYKLTDTQRKGMDDIFLQHRVTLIDLHAALDKEEVAMEPLMGADQPDEGRILAQIDRVAQARSELEKANARMLLGIRKELTPEQWKQLQADRAARREAAGPGGPMRHWRGQGGPGAPGQPAPDAPPAPGGPGQD